MSTSTFTITFAPITTTAYGKTTIATTTATVTYNETMVTTRVWLCLKCRHDRYQKESEPLPEFTAPYQY
ncbi:hypothetical protein BG015_001916 [Linnemannia schmuckeri]|uniref:Uncharacterized protein n=1 Tax=Linnemannia schmuckeri TaxID=64567 RepID=A0A9P5RRW5_9FUNG|nr:hypothetical protein BG015_001916 [Linnemannia schmuckeri]